MTTTTKTYTDNTSSSAKSTWVFKTTWQNALSVGSSSTFTIPATSVEITRTQTAYGAGAATNYIYYGSYLHYCEVLLTSWASGSTKTASSSSTTRNVSSYFNSNNPADRTYSISVTAGYQASSWASATSMTSSNSVEAWGVSLGSLVLTLNAPPTVEHDDPTYATPHYTGCGTYMISGIDAEAYYGGTIASIKLAIGADSVVQNYSSATVTEQTLSLTPSQAGTFTPTITVTDSRGQTTIKTFPQITVNSYNIPSVSFDVYRTNDIGIKNDEGHYALIQSAISYTDEAAILTEPSIQIDGVDLSNLTDASVTWYKTWSNTSGASNIISDWTTLVPQNHMVTIYGLIDWDYDTTGKFAEDTSYQITLVANDSLNHSTPITQTMSTAFYTIDFQAGGKEIAFGKPANDTLTQNQESVGLFKCGMEAQFKDAVVIERLVGEIKAYAGATVPTGWLECDGTEVAIADYPLLYNAIGTLWGTPSDADHFVLPNLMGKVPVGQDTSDTSFDIVGETGGDMTHLHSTGNFTLGTAHIPAHTHGSKTLTGSFAPLYWTTQQNKTSGIAKVAAGNKDRTAGSGTNFGTATTTITATHTHDSVGSGQAHNHGNTGSASNLQPYAVVKYIICAV